MTTTRHRPVLQNITGTGQCTKCGGHAVQLYPILRDKVEHLLCRKCRKEMNL